MSSATPKLDSCGAEPIHIPGAIQQHGALLVLSARSLSIVQASDNLTDYVDDRAAVGSTAKATVFPFIDALSDWYSSDESNFRYVWADKNLDVTAHRSAGFIVVEFEKTRQSEPAETLMAELTRFAQYLNGVPALNDALSRAAELVSAISGYDRTLIYEFGGDWSGHVVAEAGNGALPSYFGLRFPATSQAALHDQSPSDDPGCRLRACPDQPGHQF